MQEADETICDARLALDADGITEYSLSDDEDGYPVPPTSDHPQTNDEVSSSAGSSSAASYSDDEDDNTSHHRTDCTEEAQEDEAAVGCGIEHDVLEHIKT